MHDIDTIARNNEAAVGAAVRRARAQGLYVVQVSAGLNLVEYQAFRDPINAEHRAAVLRAEYPEPVSSVRVLAPLPAAEAALVLGRDQSEDYLRG